MIIELLALSHINCGTCSDKWVGHLLELKQQQEIVRVRLVHSNRNMWEHSDEGRSQNTYLHDNHVYVTLSLSYRFTVKELVTSPCVVHVTVVHLFTCTTPEHVQ